MFNILIKESSTEKLKFLKVKKEIIKEETTQVDDGSGNMIDQVVQIPTGEFETVIFETEDKDELKDKCIELLQVYSSSQIVPIDNLKYELNLNWM